MQVLPPVPVLLTPEIMDLSMRPLFHEVQDLFLKVTANFPQVSFPVPKTSLNLSMILMRKNSFLLQEKSQCFLAA
jgi:hypothetical protein